MSAASALGGTSAGESTGNGVNRFNELTSEKFVKIMMAEMTKQDPLKPNDSNALLQQVSSIRQIEGDLSLQKNLQNLVGQNQFAAASNMLGAQVTGISEENSRVVGIVTSVLRTTKGPVLMLNTGARVPVDNVDGVTFAMPEPDPDPDPNPTNNGNNGTPTNNPAPTGNVAPAVRDETPAGTGANAPVTNVSAGSPVVGATKNEE